MVIINVNVVSAGVIVIYETTWPSVDLANNFLVVVRDRPNVVFAASPVPVFRQVNVVNINVVNPSA